MWKKSVFSHSRRRSSDFRRQYRRDDLVQGGYFTIFCNSIFRPSPIRVSHTAHTQKSPLSVLPYQPLYFHLFRSSLSSIHHPQYIPCSIPFLLYPFLSLSLNPKKQRNFAINHNINIQVPKPSILKRILKLIQIHFVNCLRSIPLSANFIPLIDSN